MGFPRVKEAFPGGIPAQRRLATLLGCILLVTSMLGAPPASAQPLVTGVSNLYTNAPLAFQRTREAGADLVRIPLYWAGTAPTVQPPSWEPENPDDPAYNWRNSDEAVVNATAAGLTPVLEVDGTPRWAQRCVAPANLGGPSLCDPDPTALRQFAIAAARHYSGELAGVPRVRYWQPLNEPNLSTFFFPQYNTAGQALSPGLYRALLNGFYSAVKSVDPSNLVISAGLGPIAVPPWTIGPLSFARQMLCMTGSRHPHPTGGDCEGGVHLDIFAIHPYTTGAPSHQGKANDVELGDLDKLQRLLAAADRAGRIKGAFKHTPLWITEFSWDSKPPDPGGLPLSTETQWAAEALHVAWAAGVTHFFWYSLDDQPHGSSYKEANESGLYFRGPTLEQDRPKPVLTAFRFPFVAYPRASGLDVWGRTPTSARGRVSIQALRGRRWRRIGTLRADSHGIFRGRLSSGYGRDRRGRVRAVYRQQRSAPFPMRPVGDFYQPPFG